jgi:hypothetical protein
VLVSAFRAPHFTSLHGQFISRRDQRQITADRNRRYYSRLKQDPEKFRAHIVKKMMERKRRELRKKMGH